MHLTSLRRLDVSYNKLGDPSHDAPLPDTLFGLRSLQHCTMRHNLLQSWHLPASLEHLPSLTYLDLSANQLTYIPECVTSCASLVKLLVNHNQITEIPDSLVRMPCLKVWSGVPLLLCLCPPWGWLCCVCARGPLPCAHCFVTVS